MNDELQLLTMREFNGHELNCYVEAGQEDKSAFWATREQIGSLLGYENPRISVGNIHNRNKERLDKFSRVIKMITHEENRDVTREVRVYNFKGLLEICRYSNQPVANAVIDKLWDIADEIRRTGMYATTQALKRMEDRISKLEEQAKADYPVKLLGSIVLARPESITVQAAAQFLSEHGFEVGQNRLYKKCRDKKLLCSRKGRQYNQPTQRAIEQGLFNTEISGGFKPIAMVTPQGLQYLAEMYTSEEYPILMLLTGTEK